VLPAAYEELGVKLEVVNSTAMRMGNEAFRTRRRIGNLPMVRLRLLACGGTIGAPNAETYDITLYVVSQLSAARAGVDHALDGRPGSGPIPNFAGNDVSCVSTGAIERRIEELVRAKLPK
jgi:hypothetical protein